ncbi:MAG: hypothetical protein HOV94_41270 [Saccharothrix sp.]|nr:hypothetical protein [Saccharothrix sp.]
MLQTTAYAYCNIGRWIADCPRPHCSNAIALEPKQTSFHCGGHDGCKTIAPVEWPSDIDEISEALLARPVPATRNWAPAGHWQAIVTGFPEGQTAAELRAETAEHADKEG